MATAVSTIILQSYCEVNVIQDTTETISTPLQSDAFLKLDQWYSSQSARRNMAYLVVHGGPYTVVAGTASYTVGTAGTFTTSARPVAITGWRATSGAFVAGGTPDSYDSLRAKQQNNIGASSVLPECLAADQGFPNITIEVYPIPAASPGTLTLDFWTPLVQFASVADTLTLPDGFERWIVLGLALELETRYPLASGPRAALQRNYQLAEDAISQRVAGILSSPAPTQGQ